MNGLAQFLKAKHGLTDEQANKRAEYIMRSKIADAQKKKLRLAQAQITLDLDGTGQGEEPTNKREVTDPEINF